MAESDARGLFILFEPVPTLALLPTWWIEVPTITALGRSYHGIVIEDLIFFDWLIARDGSVLGIDFLPPKDLRDLHSRGLRTSLESLPYVDDADGMPTVWFSEMRQDDEDSDSRVLQDFAASLYVAEPARWGLAVNIDWLLVHQRDRLQEAPARWIDAECRFVEPGKGVSLCKGFPFPVLYQLRGWFGSSEGH
jgi:hypothetical protein